MKKFKTFWTDEDGAVTVDWVVLTGAVVVVAALVGTTISDPVNTELGQIATAVTSTN